MQFFTLDSSKMEVFKSCFFDIVTTQYDPPSYLKQILGRIWVFFTLFGYWVGLGGGGGGLPRNWYTTCLCSFSPWNSSKMEVFKTCFFDIILPDITISLPKAYFRLYLHVFHPIWVLGWVGGGGGGAPKGMVHTTCLCIFSLWTAPKWKFSKLVFLIF